MTIQWSPEAAADFRGIVAYIHEDNASAARRFADAIDHAANQLLSFPNLDRTGRVLNTRELVLTPWPFIVVYRVKGESVEIARVLHGSQCWP